ncbi:hypothetical protein MLD38_009250 [Melastoma candidum]|uniref:Uncharacterized protein n=1 Tax=Melastoma candidum TaxID=119954 RepID=A0ACB9RYD0_9MYRT|nr:hypothetical protein MLD38_009250 [Melastoma candidum]
MRSNSFSSATAIILVFILLNGIGIELTWNVNGLTCHDVINVAHCTYPRCTAACLHRYGGETTHGTCYNPLHSNGCICTHSC